MKQLVVMTVFFVFLASFASATDLDLDPDFTTMSTTDVKVVSACLEKSGGAPDVGKELMVETYCRDMNSNEVCDGADVHFPAGFSAIVTSSPTGGDGCGEITLTTSAASPGAYAYKVNGMDGDIVVASEHGLVLVPEFTTLGAALALGGAGFFMYRKRKR